MRAYIFPALVATVLLSQPALATGLATCDSGPKTGWKSEADLEKILVSQGWKINRIKEDGGCYEVYAIDMNGKKISAYFHPLTLDVVPTSKYP